MKKRNAILIFLIKDTDILLAESNYRPGKITWNGISGYREDKENPQQAAVRELYKGIKVRVYENDLLQTGLLHLYTLKTDDTKEETLSITIFLCEKWQGEPKMTPGIRPKWFSFDTIPYKDMFEDTKAWLPKVLEGEQFIAEVISTVNAKTSLAEVTDVLVRNVLE